MPAIIIIRHGIKREASSLFQRHGAARRLFVVKQLLFASIAFVPE